MANAPCMKCNERYFGCHGKCENYAEYTKKNKEIGKVRIQNNINSNKYVVPKCYKKPKAWMAV